MKDFNSIAIFLAARSGSRRLPNKHFLKINNKLSVIDVCIKRLKKSKRVKKIFLCTTKRKEDYKFKKVCLENGIFFFAGSTNNVLKRFIDCAKKNSIENIIRITADCPLIEPKLIDRCVKIHFKKRVDYTSNILKLSYPDGLDVEIVKLKALLKSQKICQNINNKEHVTSFIRSSKIFKKYNLKSSKDFSDRRWTLDNKQDFNFIKKIFNFFYPKIFFDWKEIIKAETKYKNLLNLKKR